MITDIIHKKRLGKELSYHELDVFFNGYLEGTVKDYQMSSLLMAICINGMTEEEIFALTKIFIDSGDTLDLSFVPGVVVDKHSTGGIGDKTTLIIAPIVASLGVPILKMSGRGLGYTGGTIDKLESIPGYRIDLSDEEVIKQVQDIGVVITGQTTSLAPMDKEIYALRDVTATVSSVPLIAVSIMSKKIAGGADKILIDIKVGNGALLKTKKEAQELSILVKKIGKVYQKEVHTIISDMNTPLGYCIGNSLEVMEAQRILKGEEIGNNLTKLCIDLSTELVCMAKGVLPQDAQDMVLQAIKSGDAYRKFLELVEAQHGDITRLSISKKCKEIKAKKSGTIESISAIKLGELSVSLGAGRISKEDSIDYGVGIELTKQVGDNVKKGEVLAKVYYKKIPHLQDFEDIFTIS